MASSVIYVLEDYLPAIRFVQSDKNNLYWAVCVCTSTLATLGMSGTELDTYILQVCCAYDGKEKAASFNIKCRLTLQKWLILMYCWAREYPVGDAAEEAEVQQKTAIDAGLPMAP